MKDFKASFKYGCFKSQISTFNADGLTLGRTDG